MNLPRAAHHGRLGAAHPVRRIALALAALVGATVLVLRRVNQPDAVGQRLGGSQLG